MVEASPPQKNDEQYPLLKVEAGEGDSRPPPSAVTPRWNVTCSPKRRWLDRWPELISACWMTGMLLGIFLLILYGLSLGVIRRQPLFLLHSNESKPASEVYYHHIVQRGNAVPFSLFSEYLSNMASLYPSLRFNIIFLIDDSYQSGFRGSRHSRFFNKLIPYRSIMEPSTIEDSNQEITNFNLKYDNVNVTVMPLSKYMHLTPLRFKWRTIPLPYLTFYARVFSVWQTGGIGMDLDMFSTQFNRRQLPDRRIRAILRQHNNGVKPEEYANTLNKIERDEQYEFASLFYGIVHQFLTLLNSQDLASKDVITVTPTQPLVRTHRSKREITEAQDFNITSNSSVASAVEQISNISSTKLILNGDIPINTNLTNTNEPDLNKTNGFKELFELANPKRQMRLEPLNRTSNKNVSEVPEVILLYDFSLFSDNNMGPSYLIPEPLTQPLLPRSEQTSPPINKKSQYLLSINADGFFISASSKQHPFLSHIISAGCQRMPPRIAIQDAILSQCSTVFRDDAYCSNIYIL